MKRNLRKTSTQLISILLFFVILSSFQDNSYTFSVSDNGTVTDIDGNVYETVTIGNQVWMAENLKVTKYSNGDPIPNITKKNEWESLKTGAYCNYKNNQKKALKYGKLYNWYAVNDERKISPEGWHIPTVEDWNELIEFLGGKDIAGGRLKESGTVHWDNPNSGAENTSGFTALPSGIRYVTGSYYSIGSGGYWWSSDVNESEMGIAYHLYYFFGTIYKYNQHKQLGISIRCIKD